jgi:DNA-directed RNA polymerase subunit RPC12/RpoP
MTNMNKNFRCASCSTDFPLSIATDLDVAEFTTVAKCPKCSSVMQIHIFSSGSGAQPQQAQQPAQGSLDESIFVPPEMPSDEIKSLIEG